MESDEFNYFESKYDRIIESIPSVTIGVRVKPIIKMILEDRAKKQGLKLSQLLNHIIIRELRSDKKDENYPDEMDKLLVENQNLQRQINEHQSQINFDTTSFNNKTSDFIERQFESNLIEFSSVVENLKKITTDHDEKMQRHFKMLEALRKIEQQNKRLHKLGD